MRFILVLLVISSFLYGMERPQIARLHYSGGGDWYNDTDTIGNIAKYLNKTINSKFSLQEVVVKPSDSKIFNYPFIFMTGHGNIKFNEKDAENLRQYLLRGGFLYADDDYGMDASFQKEIKKVFPEKELVELPKNHSLFHCFFDFPNGIPKIHKHDDKRPQAFAIFDDFGRIMVLYTYETNISDGWSNAHNDPEKLKNEAFKMGANLFYYVFTN
jgi:hypothetical protein